MFRHDPVVALAGAGAPNEQISCHYHDAHSRFARAILARDFGRDFARDFRRGREGKADAPVRARAQRLTKIRDQ